MQSDHLFKMQAYYNSGATRSYSFRKTQLLALRKAIQLQEASIIEALHKDLHKSAEEAYATEIGFVYAEITYALKHLKQWMQPKRVPTPLALFPSTSTIVRDSLGVCLIIAPWNYPLQLLLAPLVGAIAGGNCVVLKPSEFTINTTLVIDKLIRQTFLSEYIKVVQGDGAEVVSGLMNNFRFDHVFFTGSTSVGKAIARMAAEQLTPVTLELGGKSPCIVAADADIKTAARRIVWGKFTNTGQSCAAPDYVLVHYSIKNEFVQQVREAIESFYGKNISQSADFGRMVNEKRFNKLKEYLGYGNIVVGGKVDAASWYISPTIIDNISFDSPLLKEEIFGPILPVVGYTSDEEAMQLVQQHPNPLSFYLFTSNKKREQYFVERIAFGGGCINNTMVHLANMELPFGGVGASGVGQYHGKFSFETFTRPKSILKTATWLDPSLKYPPYKGKMKWLQLLLK